MRKFRVHVRGVGFLQNVSLHWCVPDFYLEILGIPRWAEQFSINGSLLNSTHWAVRLSLTMSLVSISNLVLTMIVGHCSALQETNMSVSRIKNDQELQIFNEVPSQIAPNHTTFQSDMT